MAIFVKGFKFPKEVIEKMSQTLKQRHKEKQWGFKKGQLSWNSGKKGVMPPHSGFQKGNKYGGHNFKGIIIHQQGYVLIHKPDHPFRTKGGYVFEHRLVMEANLGRLLTKEENIHHIDFDKANNKIENLHLFSSNSEHRKYHEFLKNIVREFFNSDAYKLWRAMRQ